MNKKQAIKASAGCVAIGRNGNNGWIIYGPYYTHKPSGPSTTAACTDYRTARIRATAWRVEIVLQIMGRWDEDAQFTLDRASHDFHADHTLAGMLRAVGV